MPELRQTSLERELELREAVDRAYLLARQQVFDRLPEQSSLTSQQRAVLVELEAAEAALREFRAGETAA